jgi:3-hydroxy acid dehydrogenase / malonic semialdehyde reductase
MQRTVLVTGASSGIGRAVSVDLLSEGHRVFGVARDFSKFPCEHPEFTPIRLDLANLDRLPKALRKLTPNDEDVDTLVLCAGRALFGHLEECSYEQIREIMDLNFTGQAFLVRAFLPLMKRRGHGDIILMGSEAGLQGKRGASIYGASKAALRSFAQSVREEAAASGVRVTLINAGMVNTAFFDGQPIAPGVDEANYIDPHDIAETISMLLKLRRGTVLDEINLSPLKRVVRFRHSKGDAEAQ